MPNRLAGETSPYLLQHADNPVAWYPWGPEALERARSEDRLILLSIGYSACHWCHVMAHESFADPVTAELMNEAFVNIKVDREERPDIDGIYMRAIQALTGHGGWPLTAFLTPEGVPFYGGTYYPPEPKHGMPAFRQVLKAVADAWANRRDEVMANAEGLREALERSATETVLDQAGAGAPPTYAALAEGAFRHLRGRFDEAHGGFGGAPKFPQPTTLEFLLAHGVARGEPAGIEMVVKTLRGMAAGGIRDHLAGGFHRYSVDARWLVPHFEKMLYDNALLGRLFVDAWRATGADDLLEVATETLEYVRADLRAPEGGFYAARDADSEGEEGLFYLWTPAQLEAAAPDAEAARLFARVYDVQPGGNFEGRSILHLPHGLDAIAGREGISVPELKARLEPVRRALLEARGRREPPQRDDKVLTSWSAFAVRALAEAGAVARREDWLDDARRGGRFLLEALRVDGALHHVWTAGQAKVPAFLEDRAALANACLSLHEATLEPGWLTEAEALCDELVARHLDQDAGLFYDDAEGGERLVVRPREVMDQATPSGTSLAVEALLRTGHLVDRSDWTGIARAALDRERRGMARFPAGFGRLLTQVVRLETPPLEVAVIGSRSDDRTHALARAARAGYHANRVVTGAEPDEASRSERPLLRGRGPLDGGPAAYVCRGYACDAPVDDPEQVLQRVGSAPAGS